MKNLINRLICLFRRDRTPMIEAKVPSNKNYHNFQPPCYVYKYEKTAK